MNEVGVGSCQVLDHSLRLSISLCNDCISASDKIGLYNFASSATSLQQFFSTLGMSFIKITKRIGPNTDPIM